MQEAGYNWLYCLLLSLGVYTGAFQFVLITFMSSAASLVTVALTALLMNSRQTFYALSFVKDFKAMGKKLPFMIHTLTDETYAVNCSLEEKGKEKEEVMFHVAWMSWLYWSGGAVLGAVVGQLLPYDLEGIDFCMTALFLVLFMQQWEKAQKHYPALVGICVGILCLIFVGANQFMLPALLIVSAILLIVRGKGGTS